MKKSILVILAIFSIVILGGCGKTQHSDLRSDDDIDESSFSVEITLDNACVSGTDMFVGEVVSCKKLSGDVEFENFNNYNATPMLYTVRVTRAIRALSATEGAEIKLVHYSKEKDDSLYWENMLEKGKSYLLSGFVQPYKNSAVIVDHGMMTAQHSDDGMLTPCSSMSEKALKDVETLSELLETEQLKERMSIAVDVPDVFYDFDLGIADGNEQQGTGTSQHAKPSDEQVISLLKEAIKADSDIELVER